VDGFGSVPTDHTPTAGQPVLPAWREIAARPGGGQLQWTGHPYWHIHHAAARSARGLMTAATTNSIGMREHSLSGLITGCQYQLLQLPQLMTVYLCNSLYTATADLQQQNG